MGKPLLIGILFILLASFATAWTIQDNFPGTALNSTNWYNRSVMAPTGYLNVSNSAANFYGNSTGSVQVNGGLEFSAKTGINATENATLEFTFDWDSGPTNAVMAIGLVPVGWAAGSTGGIYIQRTPTNFVVFDNYANSAAATVAYDASAHTIKINVKRSGSDTYYYVYLDGSLWVENTQSIQPKLYANFTVSSTATAYFLVKISDLTYTNENVELPGANGQGDYCDADTDCLSHYCERHKCSLKVGGTLCTFDVECYTGNCQGGRCSATDILQNLDLAKKQNFGISSAVSDFISLVIILGVLLAIVFTLKFVPGVGLVAGGWLILSTLFFTAIGWLSAYFIVGIIILCLFGVVVGAILKGAGG